jgi:hypothetical protein
MRNDWTLNTVMMAVALAALACGDSPTRPSDAGTDAGLDAGVDAGTDAGLDGGTDAGLDAGTDAGLDGGTDGGPDAGMDGGTDAGLDAGVDGGADAGFTIVYSAAGVTPNTLTIPAGTTLTYVNADVVDHQPASNPHPSHTDCPELNAGVVNPGTSAMITTGNGPKGCGFHDHLNPVDTKYQGVITTQ